MVVAQSSTHNLYNLPDKFSELEQVALFFQMQKTALTPAQIAKSLNIVKSNVNTYLQRLKRKGIIQKIGYGLWELIPPAKKQSSTTSGWGSSNLYNFEVALNDLVAFLLRYDAFHGLECHLPDISSSTEYNKSYGKWYISIKGRKLRVKSSLHPIPFSDAEKLLGAIEFLLAQFNYYGPVWLTHIELNKDHEGYKLDDVQRIEVKTILGNIYRLYNKSIDGRDYLRSESIINHKSKIISLAGGLHVLSVANDIEDLHTITKMQLHELQKSHGELFYLRQNIMDSDAKKAAAIDKLSDRVTTAFGYLQGQLLDFDQKLDQFTDDRQINTAILEELQTHTRQNNSQIQQNEFQSMLLTRILEKNDFLEERMYELTEVVQLVQQLVQNQKTWMDLTFEHRKEVLTELRKLGKSYREISDIVHTSNVYVWINRNAPEIKDVKSSVNAKEQLISENSKVVQSSVNANLHPDVLLPTNFESCTTVNNWELLQNILQFIAANPGAKNTQIRNALRKRNTIITHALRTLEQASLIKNHGKIGSRGYQWYVNSHFKEENNNE